MIASNETCSNETHAASEAEVGADEGERHGHAEPKGEDGKQCQEGNCSATVLRPQETVEEEDGSEKESENETQESTTWQHNRVSAETHSLPRTEEGGQQDVALPLLSSKHCNDTRVSVPPLII